MSLVIFFILLYFILIHWYPQPLFATDGGWRVIRIIIGVDLVLGPLLTLIVFKPGKPGLKFDLYLIALIQTLALSWGVWTTYNERPAAVIFTLDFFTPVPAYQLKDAGIKLNQLRKYGESWPVIIFSDIPEIKHSEVILKSIKEGKPAYLMNEYFSKLSKQQKPVFLKHSMNLEKYVADKPELKVKYENTVSKYKNRKLSLLALHSRERWVTAVFDLDKLEIIDTIEIDPSEYQRSIEIEFIDKQGKRRRLVPKKR